MNLSLSTRFLDIAAADPRGARMSHSTTVSAPSGRLRSEPIRREVPPRDQAPVPMHAVPAQAATTHTMSVPPTGAPHAAAPQRPRLMWLILALSTALVGLFFARNIVQGAAINTYLSDTAPWATDAAGITVSSAGWIVDTSFVIATAWAAMAVYAFSGSRLGRTIFTAFLASGVIFGIWSAVNPPAAAIGPGELILALAHPYFMSVTSLVVAMLSITLLVLLYRPAVNRYFRERSQ